ncbi:hypothetical protein [Halorarius halobius]|uniref:hypothetical protein n=1 Tax=Halorarius halobius TaxID=2962671 RepID=UPI0020CD6CCE|nr:hypothetical protein [Halorarius halobius]
MDVLSDPETLRGAAGVASSEETVVDDADALDYFDSIAGMVAIGARSDDAVLLMESPHGWRLPYTTVAPDDDWVVTAERFAAALTGDAPAVAGIERVARITHHDEDGDRVTTTHDVVVGTDPVDGRPVAEAPAFGPWDEMTVAWFESVPDDAYWDHEDAVADVRRFL